MRRLLAGRLPILGCAPALQADVPQCRLMLTSSLFKGDLIAFVQSVSDVSSVHKSGGFEGTDRTFAPRHGPALVAVEPEELGCHIGEDGCLPLRPSPY